MAPLGEHFSLISGNKLFIVRLNVNDVNGKTAARWCGGWKPSGWVLSVCFLSSSSQYELGYQRHLLRQQ